jgi:hypothetical protein
MESFVKNISSIYCYPVNFHLAGDNFITNQTPIYFDNGLYFNVHNFLNEPEDVKINRQTGMFLTNLLSSKDIFVDYQKPSNVQKINFIQTAVADLSSNIISLSARDGINRLTKSERTIFNSSDSFKFVFYQDSIQVEASDGSYLTYSGTVGENSLYFSAKISPPPTEQKFEYLIGEDSIILFGYGSNYGNTIARYGTGVYGMSSINFNPSVKFSPLMIFNFTSYKDINLSYKTVANSYFAKYESSPIASQEEIIPTQKSISETYKQNYLGMFPFESPNIKNEVAEYELYIHGLKNYQTPEYNYSQGIKYYNETNTVRRFYRNIFSGTNQKEGSKNIYLGYTANTLEKIFPEDTYTTFHYPAVSPRGLLQFSGLLEDGAYSGEVPYVSDRIYSKQIDYQDIIPNSPQPPSIKRQDGTWLCSWLQTFGNSSRWLDRYYNAAYYTSEQALSASALIYNRKLNMNKPFEVWDEPSQMILEPGAQYSYFRSGLNTSKEFLKFLTADFNKPLGAKTLDVDSYNDINIIDNSNYKNNGLLFNNKPENLQGNYLNLDGTNHAIFPAKNILLEQNALTLSIWIKVDDWGNITGEQIIGNYYDSGFGFINDSALTAPIFTLLNSTSGIFYNLNYKLAQIENIVLPNVASQENQIIQRLSDFTYWIIDSKNRILRKYGVEGSLKIEVTIPVASASYINQVEIDAFENLYIYDATNKKGVMLDTLGQTFSSFQFNQNYQRIEIDLFNKIVPVFGNASVIDNNNNLWEMVGGNLYKNRLVYANIGPVQQLSCDAKNNLWIVYVKDKLSKLNLNTETFEFTKSIGKNVLIDDTCFNFTNQFRFINFVRTPKTGTECIATSDKTEDLLVLVDDSDKELYLINLDGLLISRINMNSLLATNFSTVQRNVSFKALGDFSGYQYLRKYAVSDKSLSWKFKIADVDGKNAQLLSLKYQVDNLPSGWHNFVFNFDSEKGIAKYYIDTQLVQEILFSPNRYQLYYDFRSSILLGASNIKNTTLNDIIKIDDAYKFIGNVGSILMYTKSLTKGEIEQMYYSSPFAISKGPLRWNLVTGERNYVEEIQHWFEMQLPSNKSKYFNINIHGLTEDLEVKNLVEDAIRSNLKKIAPAYTELYKINWI